MGINASRFSDILKATAIRNMDKLCEKIVFPRKLANIPVIHGLKYEKAAMHQFEVKTNEKVHSCGLFVDETHPFLAASPDGVIKNTHIIEVKCPYKGYQKQVAATSSFPFLMLDSGDNKLHLKKTSSYYMQIQGQLAITKRKSCFFVVYTVADIFIEEIVLDEEYWNLCMLPRLTLFYEKYLRPYIARHCF